MLQKLKSWDLCFLPFQPEDSSSSADTEEDERGNSSKPPDEDGPDRTEQEIQTQLLPEQTTAESEFPNHDRIVNALEQTVTSKEPGQSIALLGELGSGKSTILRMLSDRFHKRSEDANDEPIEDNVDARVFTYDAWTHRGESIRRSFIQELSDFLDKEEWVERENLQNEVGRVRLRKSTATNKITPVGWILAVILTLLPPSLLLTQAGHWDEFIEGFSLKTGVVGGTVVVVLLIASLIIFIVLLFRNGDLLSSETTTEESERSEPSTVDFRKSFRGIASRVLDFPGRRLVIAIENLDRLDSPEATRVWTTLQTFFDIHTPTYGTRPANSEEQELEWRDRFWLIVPFSPKALASTPLNDTAGIELSTAKDTINLSERAEGGRTDLLEYIDKTFQVTWHVTEPVPSNQEEYFETQLDTALPSLEDSKAAQIRELYTMHGKRQTPRDVSRFLNDLVGSVRKWREEVPIPVQALYQLWVRTLGSDVIEKITQDHTKLGAESIVCQIATVDLQKQLLQLHYGVDSAEEALQILIGEDINQYLRQGDSEKLKDLQRRELPGFEQILRNKVRSIARGRATNLLPRAAQALSELGDDSNTVENRARLAEAVQRVDEWDFYNESVGKGLASLLCKLEKKEYETTAQSLLRAISQREDDSESP